MHFEALGTLVLLALAVTVGVFTAVLIVEALVRVVLALDGVAKLLLQPL
jgi:hypothetical protein